MTNNFDKAEPLAGLAESASESVREMIHMTQSGTILAPVIYGTLYDLSGMCARTEQLLGQFGKGLIRSAAEDDVYDHKGDPRETAYNANVLFIEAGQLLAQAGKLLQEAHIVINSQGLNG